MISYEPLWKTMKDKGVTSYALLKKHNFSNGTFSRLKQGVPVSVTTIDSLCKILNCRVEDVLLYVEDEGAGL